MALLSKIRWRPAMRVKTGIEELLKEFRGRPALDRLRAAIRVASTITDPEMAYRRLAADLVYHMRRRGVRLKDVSLTTGTFDFGQVWAVACDGTVEKDPAASAIIFITDHYKKMADQAHAERAAMANLLMVCSRSRSMKAVKKRIRKALGNG